MILYIIYVEPLLHALEKRLRGLRIPAFLHSQSEIREVLEAYCDDINVLTDDLDDFGRLADIISTFEKFSGALLSRNQKCKIVGLGNWASKSDWPISWLQSVETVKVFGIFLSNSYSEMK